MDEKKESGNCELCREEEIPVRLSKNEFGSPNPINIYLCEKCYELDEQGHEVLQNYYGLREKVEHQQERIKYLEARLKGSRVSELEEELEKLKGWIREFYNKEMTDEQKAEHYNFLHRGHKDISWIV